VPSIGATLASACVAVPVASEPRRANPNFPVSPRSCRKNPATLVPAMETNVWNPESESSFTHADTVKLPEVSTTGPVTVARPALVPETLIAFGPIWPVTHCTPLLSVAVFP
jgi:hypothetical protein